MKENSRLFKILKEFKEYKKQENKIYYEHYLLNIFKILLNKKPTNYGLISHENKLVHGFNYDFNKGKENKLMNSLIYNLETKKFE